MAGTGDLVLLRRLRSLHGHHTSASSTTPPPKTTYGSHMAAHLAVGALFLGSGSVTFGTSDLALAALVIAFYPIWPAGVADNRAHLQAFRHFWVMAAEGRCLVAREGGAGREVGVGVEVTLRGQAGGATTVVRKKTPCLLPPLEDILRIRTDAAAQGFWDITIDLEDQDDDDDGKSTNKTKTTRSELAHFLRTHQALRLSRRPPEEAAFAATMSALGRERGGLLGRGDEDNQPDGAEPMDTAKAAQMALASSAKRKTKKEKFRRREEEPPFAWVFGLPGLRDRLTRAEREGVLVDGGGEGLGRAGGAAAAAGTTGVDVRLVMESVFGEAAGGQQNGVGGHGGWWWGSSGVTERVRGLKVLFEWAERRAGLLLPPPAPLPCIEQEDVTVAAAADVEGAASASTAMVVEEGNDEDKTTTTTTTTTTGKKAGKRRKRVEIHESTAGRAGRRKDEGAGAGGVGVEEKNAAVTAASAEWWIRDGVVEEMKGRAWLAGRE